MSPARLRSFFFPALLASLAVLVTTYRLELVAGLESCALCQSQRLMLGLYGLACLLALLRCPARWRGHRHVWMALCSALAGALLAGRHVWLQGEAVPLAGCPAPLAGQPLAEILVRSLWGGPECIAINWSFLDLTLPEWSLLAFVLLALPPLCVLLTARFRQLLAI